jgi:hypothetical protein
MRCCPLCGFSGSLAKLDEAAVGQRNRLADMRFSLRGCAFALIAKRMPNLHETDPMLLLCIALAAHLVKIVTASPQKQALRTNLATNVNGGA